MNTFFVFGKIKSLIGFYSVDFRENSLLKLTISAVDCCLKNSFTFHSFIHCMEAFITFVRIKKTINNLIIRLYRNTF